jgi:hypothetical protein
MHVLLFSLLWCGTFLPARIIHNKFVDEEHRLHIAFGKLEVEKQRRKELVAQSIAAVERYRDLEQKIHRRMVELNGQTHKRGTAALKPENLTSIIGLIGEMEILLEQFPALRSKEPYAHLMETIQHAGLRVTNARLQFNERIYEYNLMCRMFPYRGFALVFGFDEVLYSDHLGHKAL